MASRELYWNPTGNANWGDANVWSLTDGGTRDQSTPTLEDNCHFTSTNVYKCTVAATADCANLTFNGGTGFTGEFKLSGNINIYGDVILYSGMNFSSTIYTLSFSKTGIQTLTTNTITVPANVYVGNSTTLRLLDDLSCPQCYGGGTSSKINPDSHSLTCSAWGQDILPTMTTGTYLNLSITGNALKNLAVSLYGDVTTSGNFTITGNSAINRLFIRSSTIGTARTITCNGTVSVDKADFRDITGAGSGSWDLSGAAGYSGNCGGNSGITFTTATTQDCSAGTTWSTATWTSRVPLPQDTATFSGSSRTITQDMPRIGSVNFTGSSGLTWTTSTTCSCFGSINLTDLGTLTASTQTYTFEGRNYNSMPAGGWTITCSGKTWEKTIAINAPTGTYKISDSFYSNNPVQLWNGELNTNNQAMQSSTFVPQAGTKTITLGSTVWSLNGANTTPLSFAGSSGLTITANTATFKFTGALTGNITYNGNGISLNGASLWNATTNNYVLIVLNSSTVNDFKIEAGREVNFTQSTTTTVTTFTALGTSGSHIVIHSTTATNATLAKAGGGVITGCDYIDFTDINGTPADTWYVGVNSTDATTTCSGLIFEAPPAGTAVPVLMNSHRRRAA